MDPQDLKRVDELFHAALEQPASRRAEFLVAAVVDELIRARVAGLLRAHDAASGYFTGLSEHFASAGDIASAAETPLRIGPYRTLKVLGQGGMGTVFLAERADGQFNQQVALKLIRLGMDTDEGVRRFLVERQIVARLEHPNIARLLDGGISEDGRPYFVMEYIAGRPLLQYCDEARLPIAQRLALVITAGEAIQYAHQSLVVHRDVKPSNILVTTDGTVKLLDFGIAKLLDPDAAVVAGATEAGQRLHTLPYAAPEQIRGGPITTATDVFALGVVLYELLTGCRPHRPADGNAHDLEQAILEQAPERPSVAVLSDPAVAVTRATRPDRLHRHLGGDLDTICLMALRKEPERRYASAGHLVDDLRRYVRGLPVLARSDTWRYRSTKFIRRHAVGVAATAAIVVLLVGIGTVSVVQSARAAREGDKAREVAELLVRLFEVADPSEARGASITAREVLGRGVARMQSELGGQPELKATLLAVMGRVYQNLGLYREATPLVESALALQRERLGASHRDVVAGMTALGELFRLRGDFKHAESLQREALALSVRVHGATAPETAKLLNGLSKVLIATGKPAEGEQLARRALEANRAALGSGHLEVGESLMNLGASLFVQGNDKAAEPLFRDALALRRQALGADHPNVLAALSNLAALLTRKGAYGEAEAAHRESIEISRRVFGAEHPRVATTLNNLGLLLYQRADYASAEPLFRESLAMRRKMLDASHVEIAQSLANLGLLLQQTGRAAEAEPLHREALAIRQRALGPRHSLVAQSLNNLALLLQARAEFDAAESLFRQSLEILRALPGNAHLVATNLHNLGGLFYAKRDAAGAVPFYREALEIRRKSLPEGHPETTLTLGGLGRALLDTDHAAEAAPLLAEAHLALTKAADSGADAGARKRLTDVRESLARAYERLGDTARAKAVRAQMSSEK